MKQSKQTKRAAAQVAQMNALTNQVRQLTALATAGNARPSVVAKRNRKGRKGGGPAASMVTGLAPLSQSNIRIGGRKMKETINGRGNRCLVFEEYVQDVITSPTSLAFSVTSFPIQPGISSLFAWLADQAISYQEYRFQSLAFRFETDQSANTAGKVMYAFDPDAADPLPANKQEMLEFGNKAKSAIWQQFKLPIPLNVALGRERYIRTGNLAANLDIKTYDFGQLFVASSGVVGASINIGELYVEYSIELITPVVQALAMAQARGVKITSAVAISKTVPFGTAPTFVGGLNILPNAAGTGLIFNRVGNYIIVVDVVGTGLVTVSPGFNPSAQVGVVITTLGGVSNAAANVGTEAVFMWVAVVSTRGATCTIDYTGNSGTVTGQTMRIATYSEV